MATARIKAISQGVSGAAFACFAMYMVFRMVRLLFWCQP